LDSARQRLQGLLEVSEIEAGLQTAGWLQGGVDGAAAARAAARRDVEVTPLGRYGRGGVGRPGLHLGVGRGGPGGNKGGGAEDAAALEELRTPWPGGR